MARIGGSFYDVNMEDKTERQIAHLAMIQAIIARMAANCFALKSLAVTLCAGVIALIGAVSNPSWVYLIAAAGPVLVFGWLDASYLQMERLYRKLYDDVRKGVEMEPFDMCVDRYEAQVEPAIRIALTWSVSWLYGTLLAVLALIGYMRA